MTERTRAPLLVAVIACAPFIPTHSHAQGMAAGPNDGEHATDADGASEFEWKRFQTRFAYFDQRGRGPQSRAGSRRGRGSEDLQIYQPIARLEVGQGPDIDHAVTVPVDVVSAASADALDAVSRASLVNESGGFDYAGTWRATGDDTFGLRAGVLVEEPLRAGSLGLRYRRDLADDNASIAGSFNAVYDHRKNIFYDGEQETGEFVDRWTANANLSGHQVLSATTLLHLSYGLTYQRGALETTWNSLPVDGDVELVPSSCAFEPTTCEQLLARTSEILPDQRVRHALSALVAQRIPATRTTLRTSYRFYRDNFGLAAHSAETQAYQALPFRLLFRLHYRLHTQTGVRFWTSSWLPEDHEGDRPRTADSDMERFTAHEVGGKLGIPLTAQWSRPSVSVDLSYTHYSRSNGLHMNIGAGSLTTTW